MMNKKVILLTLVIFALAAIFWPESAPVLGQGGASLFLSPSSGTFAVGDTVSVNILLNTGDNFINAVEARLRFPPDKLQVVSPSIGKSFIETWVGQPQYSNVDGEMSFQGVVPSPGIKTSQGLISSVTFRVKSTGRAIISFTDESKILLNDGKATDVLSEKAGAILSLTVPPPAGPIVTSPTHPDQARWYPLGNAVLEWADAFGVDGYSFMIDDNSVAVPDNIAEPDRYNVSYKNLPSGVSYFHIKAMRGGVWGGVTHYILNIDTVPPAAFKPKIDPRRKTTQTHPVINFITTDAESGIDHYELKVVALSPVSIAEAAAGDLKRPQEFFIEAASPFVPELKPGDFDVIVRAYDLAGNFREGKERLIILTPAWQFIGWVTPSSIWSLLLVVLILAASVYFSYRFRKWHKEVHKRQQDGALSHDDIKRQLETLKKYQKRYGQLAAVFLLLFLSGTLLFQPMSVAALTEEDLPAPLVTTLSEGISNEEVFYVGGLLKASGALVNIYLQHEQSGQTFRFTAPSDGKGEWFYIHNEFLPVGSYRLWTQAVAGQSESAPSPEYSFVVSPTALQLGASRLSYETIYFLLTLLLLLGILGFVSHGIYHFYHGKKKHALLLKEIREAEESIRRGFAILRRDIRGELDAIHKIKMSQTLRREEEEREKELLSDLQTIEAAIGREVWDIRLQS